MLAYVNLPTMNKTLSALILFGVAGAMPAWGQQTFAINFDTISNWTAGSASINNYATDHTYVDSGWTFTGGPALRNTTSEQDGVAGAFGAHSWRLRDVSNVTFTAVYGLALAPNERFTGFSFDARRWDGSPSPAFTVSYSLNGGASWTTSSVGSSGVLNNTAFGDSSSWKSFSDTLTSISGLAANQFMVRFQTSGTTERIMIDNFGAVTAIPEPASAAALLGGAGVLVALGSRRRRRV